MKLLTVFCTFYLVITFNLFAEENENKLRYVSEDLFIYMHAGAGKNYRIVGTATAGEPIQLTGESNQEFSEIINQANKTGWIENKYISDQQGLRYTVTELKKKLTQLEDDNSALTQNLTQKKDLLAQYKLEHENADNQISQLTKELTAIKAKLKTQDIDIQKEWFFNGAIVLVGGLLLGLIIPNIFSRRKSRMQSWK